MSQDEEGRDVSRPTSPEAQQELSKLACPICHTDLLTSWTRDNSDDAGITCLACGVDFKPAEAVGAARAPQLKDPPFDDWASRLADQFLPIDVDDRERELIECGIIEALQKAYRLGQQQMGPR